METAEMLYFPIFSAGGKKGSDKKEKGLNWH